MESGSCQDQNQGFQNDYDDEHDSDVEARLYAEVYHSNTIIGEENISNSTSENQCTNVLNGFHKNNSENQNLLHGKNTNQQNSNGNILHDSSIARLNDSTNNAINSVQNANQESNAQDVINSSRTSLCSQKVSDSSNTPSSKKRISNSCLDEINKSSKKKKRENQSGTREAQPNQQKDNAIQITGGSLINPYNKNVLSNKQKGMKLLSPEFINLVFTGKSQKKKRKEFPLKKDKSKGASTCNGMPTADTNVQPSNMKPTESSHEKGVATETSVIDISSESCNESDQDDSKYNTIVATDKKLRRRESGLRNSIVQDTSDSEESILEVPIPPKPAPPLIEVKDSDNEHEDPDASDKDISLNDSLNSQETIVQSDHEISLDLSMNKTMDTCEIISDSDDSNSLILNCTQVPKGVSSLSEIKKINQQTSQNNLSINKNPCSQNRPESSKNNSSLKTKQKSASSSKNLSAEEYFFQPMTEKMTSFYNDSWGGENFEMDEIKSSMSRDPNKWAILNKDLVLTGPRKKRYFGMTCARCHKDGHRQNDCPEPNKGPTCHMCGTSGHFATYCPHTRCLTCGRKQTMYRTSCGYCEKLFCTRCRSQGHRDDSCPDLWRRYHHTTNSAAPKIPLNVKNVMKSRHELFCCNCTKQGHDSMACRKLRWSQHFPNPSFVTHYNGPIYKTVTNIDPSLIVDDMQERSCNVFNNLPNSNNLFSNSVTSKTVPTSFPRSNRRNENIAQNGLSSSSNSDKNIIFHVLGMKTKSNDASQSIKSITLKFNVPNASNSNLVDSWKKLSDFLRGLLPDMAAVFRLERKDKHLLMYITCSRKYIECLSTLIKQYANRNDLERSQMLLSGERTIKVIVEELSQKFAEMKNLDQDILNLDGKIRCLREEIGKEGQVTNKLHNRLKLDEFVSSQQKLLMLLYREGFGDESLGQLRKLFLKMQKLIEQCPHERKTKKKSRYVPVSLVSFKLLFTYLYHYNNIFVPCDSKRLDIYIQKYKDNLDKRKKLMNSSLLFPEKTTEKQDDSSKVNTQNCTSDDKASGNSSEPLPSTSQELPILHKTVTETPKDIITDNSKTTISASSSVASKAPTQKSVRNLNGLYLKAIRAKTPALQENLMQNFRNYLKNTRNCLEKASKLNSPRLRNDILDLQRDLEDETHLSTKKVRKFKKKVHEESLRLQGVTKKLTKSPEISNANRTYKKFRASL